MRADLLHADRHDEGNSRFFAILRTLLQTLQILRSWRFAFTGIRTSVWQNSKRSPADIFYPEQPKILISIKIWQIVFLFLEISRKIISP
jgi:hypothetical protein